MISKDLWHSLRVKKPVPSIFSRKLTWPCQYSHQPLVEWRPKILHKTNTVIKVKVPLFALCQHWLKLHVLCLIMMAHHDRCIRERVITLLRRDGCLSALPASSTDFPCPLQRNRYGNTGGISKLECVRQLGFVSLSRQADVELLGWPPRAPATNPIENMWSEV